MYKMELNMGKRVFSVPRAAISRLCEAETAQLRVLLALCSGEAEDIDGVCGMLLLPREVVEKAIDFWVACGVFELSGGTLRPNFSQKAENRPEKPKRHLEPPQYTMEEIDFASGKNPSLASLFQLTQKRLNKTLNPSDTRILYSFCDYYGMEPAAVMVLVEYMAEKGKGSMRQIEKTVVFFDDAGIKTLEEVTDYLERKRIRDSFEGEVRRLFGLGSRAFTVNEKAAVQAWQDKFSLSKEMLAVAYEKTVDATSSPSIHYANKIIERWAESGISSAEQAIADKKDGKSGAKGKKSSVSGNVDMQAFEEWSWKDLEKIIGE